MILIVLAQQLPRCLSLHGLFHLWFLLVYFANRSLTTWLAAMSPATGGTKGTLPGVLRPSAARFRFRLEQRFVGQLGGIDYLQVGDASFFEFLPHDPRQSVTGGLGKIGDGKGRGV